VLEAPELAAQIQALPAPVLGKLIQHVGLEDAGELVALATTEQLARIFDEELWRSARPGEDERFDSERFVLWLEIMLEAGERAVAERLAELPQDLVTLAFQRHLLVIAFDDLRAELESDDDDARAAEKAFENCLSEEIDEYQLIWRGGDGFDHVLAALLALDRDHHSLCVDLLERCARMSQEYIADNGGLCDVLSSEEMLETDNAAERETRRAERGYVSPSAAAAFLRLARSAVTKSIPYTEHDPSTRAYFRELSPTPTRAAPAAEAPSPGRDLAQLLAASGIGQEEAPRPLLGSGKPSKEEPLVIVGLRELAVLAPEKFAERSEELAYLSNVLVAAGLMNGDGQRLRPVEAVEYALVCVSLGLSLVCGARPSPSDAARMLLEYPCDGLLRLAFAKAADPKPGAKNALKMRALVENLLRQVRLGLA
jgi:hypothetical protein